MAYLIAISASLGLLIAFVLLSSLETRTGVRLLSGPRKHLDRTVARATYVATHIDWGAFIAHVAKAAAERTAHDIVHATLIVVRTTERVLTRTIRTLRERVANHAPKDTPVEGSQLIATIVRFRKNLTKKDS